MYKLKLYITGQTPRSGKLVRELKDLLDKNCAGRYTMEVINIFDNPESAYDDKVLATPTLIKTLPPPARKIIGDLSDKERVLAALAIEPIDSSDPR